MIRPKFSSGVAMRFPKVFFLISFLVYGFFDENNFVIPLVPYLINTVGQFRSLEVMFVFYLEIAMMNMIIPTDFVCRGSPELMQIMSGE